MKSFLSLCFTVFFCPDKTEKNKLTFNYSSLNFTEQYLTPKVDIDIFVSSKTSRNITDFLISYALYEILI